MEAAVEIVRTRLAQDKGKVLVFCYSLVMLDILSIGLSKNGIDSLRYQGSIPKERRLATVEQFQSHIGPRVLLVTSGAGGVGLNLFAATTAIIICPEWSPSKGEQLIRRAYRIGQTKSVKVFRLIAQDSIDQRVIEVQSLKNDKRNALLDLNAVVGHVVAAKEAKKRKKTLDTVEQVRSFESEAFQAHVRQRDSFSARTC
jgi:SNF2 family DNA or RNA helicase